MWHPKMRGTLRGVAKGCFRIDSKHGAHGSTTKTLWRPADGNMLCESETLPSGLANTMWTWTSSVLEATTMDQRTSQMYGWLDLLSTLPNPWLWHNPMEEEGPIKNLYVHKQSYQWSSKPDLIWLGLKKNIMRVFASEHCGANSIM